MTQSEIYASLLCPSEYLNQGRKVKGQIIRKSNEMRGEAEAEEHWLRATWQGTSNYSRRLCESHLRLSGAGQGVRAGVQKLKGGRPRTDC